MISDLHFPLPKNLRSLISLSVKKRHLPLSTFSGSGPQRSPGPGVYIIAQVFEDAAHDLLRPLCISTPSWVLILIVCIGEYIHAAGPYPYHTFQDLIKILFIKGLFNVTA